MMPRSRIDHVPVRDVQPMRKPTRKSSRPPATTRARAGAAGPAPAARSPIQSMRPARRRSGRRSGPRRRCWRRRRRRRLTPKAMRTANEVAHAQEPRGSTNRAMKKRERIRHEGRVDLAPEGAGVAAGPSTRPADRSTPRHLPGHVADVDLRDLLGLLAARGLLTCEREPDFWRRCRRRRGHCGARGPPWACGPRSARPGDGEPVARAGGRCSWTHQSLSWAGAAVSNASAAAAHGGDAGGPAIRAGSAPGAPPAPAPRYASAWLSGPVTVTVQCGRRVVARVTPSPPSSDEDVGRRAAARPRPSCCSAASPGRR